MNQNELAIDGGNPVRNKPLPLEFPGIHLMDQREVDSTVCGVKSRSPFRYGGTQLRKEVGKVEREIVHYLICAKSLHLVLLILGSSLIFPAFSQEVAVYVTSKAGDRLASKPPLHFVEKAARPEPAFHVDDATAYQKIDGFGASFLEAGPICLQSLDGSAQEAVLQAVFDARQGAGFSAMKAVIGATDFQSAGPYDTYDDVPGDLKLLLKSCR